MKRISATFTGQDGSLGYQNGETYELFIEKFRFHSIRICRPGSQDWCPYRNIETFLENWTHIEVAEERKEQEHV